jgi:uncharacterized membrane protein
MNTTIKLFPIRTMKSMTLATIVTVFAIVANEIVSCVYLSEFFKTFDDYMPSDLVMFFCQTILSVLYVVFAVVCILLYSKNKYNVLKVFLIISFSILFIYTLLIFNVAIGKIIEFDDKFKDASYWRIISTIPLLTYGLFTIFFFVTVFKKVQD